MSNRDWQFKEPLSDVKDKLEIINRLMYKQFHKVRTELIESRLFEDLITLETDIFEYLQSPSGKKILLDLAMHYPPYQNEPQIVHWKDLISKGGDSDKLLSLELLGEYTPLMGRGNLSYDYLKKMRLYSEKKNALRQFFRNSLGLFQTDNDALKFQMQKVNQIRELIRKGLLSMIIEDRSFEKWRKFAFFFGMVFRGLPSELGYEKRLVILRNQFKRAGVMHPDISNHIHEIFYVPRVVENMTKTNKSEKHMQDMENVLKSINENEKVIQKSLISIGIDAYHDQNPHDEVRFQYLSKMATTFLSQKEFVSALYTIQRLLNLLIEKNPMQEVHPTMRDPRYNKAISSQYSSNYMFSTNHTNAVVPFLKNTKSEKQFVVDQYNVQLIQLLSDLI